MNKTLTIEIVYGNCDHQVIVKQTCQIGTLVAQVLDQAQLDISWREYTIGSFSQFIDVNSPLLHDCRLEIYRPLLIDPKQARLLRAKENPLVRLKHRNIRGFDSRLELIETD